VDISQINNRIIKKEDQTLNNIFNLIGQTLNLKNHSIAGNKSNTEIICSDIEGHFGIDRNYYLVDTTRLFPPETPFQQNSWNPEHLFTFLRPELVQTSQSPINNDCFSVFWNGNEQKKIEEEGNIRKLTDSMYFKIIPELSNSIQNEIVKINNFDEIKQILHENMLNLRHLPYLIKNILNIDENQQKLSNESKKSLDFLFIELFSRILKWEWYSIRGNLEQKQEKTNSLINYFFPASKNENPNYLQNWVGLLKAYFSTKSNKLNNSIQFSGKCFKYLENNNDLFEKV